MRYNVQNDWCNDFFGIDIHFMLNVVLFWENDTEKNFIYCTSIQSGK